MQFSSESTWIVWIMLNCNSIIQQNEFDGEKKSIVVGVYTRSNDPIIQQFRWISGQFYSLLKWAYLTFISGTIVRECH